MNITYQVIKSGAMWRVIDRSKGGRVVGFGGTYQVAVSKAEALESKLRAVTSYLIASRKFAA